MPQAELCQGLRSPSHLLSSLFHLALLPGVGKGIKCAERVCEFTQAALALCTTTLEQLRAQWGAVGVVVRRYVDTRV